ncbi:hypothetical protein ACWDTG_01990 [Rhodococcus zopfii]|uniref:hypothetical protein n=1 Tax=Rhodococcus zopfii TaxID=43772 RepID=UPI0014868D13|nr:hypothetical protein [Rhodococcus zopfii]
MWWWIAIGGAAWVMVSAGAALILGRILRRADTEEQIVEIQRSRRDDSHTELS